MGCAFLEVLDEVQAGLRALFGTENALTLPLSATGSAGMEACFVNLLEPGDSVVIGVAGVFGTRMCDVAANDWNRKHARKRERLHDRFPSISKPLHSPNSAPKPLRRSRG